MAIDGKRLLVLDMDQTLIHADEKPFELAQARTANYHLAIRPGLVDMLDRLQPHYDFLLWSNSGLPYIHEMLNAFWPEQFQLVGILSQADCGKIVREGQATPHFKNVKTLRARFPQYRREDIVGIDDKPEVYANNYGNLIQVAPYRGGSDFELGQLTDYLLSISSCPNLSKLEKRGWKGIVRKLRYEAETVDDTATIDCH
ncbi:HAD family hydrolase (plasmid) [Pseudomonas silesiensis]|uniref:HAD family hydrolase n=1 Tax=Pseudomonas silesiensis TaxID=1853130 RepID=UPI0030D1D9E7